MSHRKDLLLILFAVLQFVAVVLSSKWVEKDLGLGFTEGMSGYSSPGVATYQQGYDEGKQAGNTVSFVLNVAIPHMAAFLKDPLHVASATGSIQVKGLTDKTGSAPLTSNASLEIFDNGVGPERYLNLQYHLPFFDDQGNAVHLEGNKYLYSNSCLDLYTEATTLFVHVRTGHQQNVGAILSTGIVTIGTLGVAELLLSMQIIGEGNDAEMLTVVVSFLSFLGGDIEQDCFNFTKDDEVDFWYTWASDGQNGFLLDLIKRPWTLELRLDLYSATPGVPPVVVKQFLPLSKFSNNSDSISMGPITLNHTGASGKVNSIGVDVRLQLDGRSMDFIPPILFEEFPFLPNFQAHYGTFLSGTVNGKTYAAPLPMIYCTYPILIGAQYWEWILMTGLHFEGTDLQVQVVGTKLFGLWVAGAYVRYEGKEYHLSDPVLFETSFYNTGTLINNRTAVLIAATVATVMEDLSLDISCTAPVDKFAFLEKEGDTYIYTTVLGTCVAQDKLNNKVWKTKANSLMEMKSYNPILPS